MKTALKSRKHVKVRTHNSIAIFKARKRLDDQIIIASSKISQIAYKHVNVHENRR